MEQQLIDEKYMRRCLQLARQGWQNAKPNPMVGAVIVSACGRILGEGYHVCCGQGHAEVNAFAAVKPEDEPLLAQSTIYVSLEPCAHYGRTPPCAKLIADKGVKRVVVGCVDPFARVSGRGIEILREAGIDVTVGVLEEECRALNRRFITFNTKHRPYVILKWCQTLNGFIDDNFCPVMLSTPFTQMLSHKLRAENDAILVGRVTAERDHPQLTVRRWWGRNPMRLVIDRHHPFAEGVDFSQPVIPQLMDYLYGQGVQSLIVEGGAETLRRFMEQPDSWDEIRVEVAHTTVTGGTQAPQLPADALLSGCCHYDGNDIFYYRHR